MKPSYESTLRDLALSDERIVVMTAENRAAIRGLPLRLGPRFIDTGITEQTMIGMAAGLALRGRIPVVHALAAFLSMRPFEFIRTDVGVASLPVKLVGGVPGVLSEANGPTHQALEDISLMRGIPNVRVFCPADVEDLLIGLPHVIGDPWPWYIRFNDRPAVTPHASRFGVGQAETVLVGDDIAILVAGALFREAYEAARELEALGRSVTLVNLRTLDPIDEAVVVGCARRARLLVLVEDHFRTGGLNSIVAEILVRHRLATEVLSIAFDDRWFTPALLDDVLRVERLTGGQVADRIRRQLDRVAA
jgi:transketolase